MLQNCKNHNKIKNDEAVIRGLWITVTMYVH